MAAFAGHKLVVLAGNELELRIADLCRAMEADVIVINEIRLPDDQTDSDATPLHRGLRIQLAFDRPEAVGLLTRLLEGADIVIDGVYMAAPNAIAGMKEWLGDLMRNLPVQAV